MPDEKDVLEHLLLPHHVGSSSQQVATAGPSRSPRTEGVPCSPAASSLGECLSVGTATFWEGTPGPRAGCPQALAPGLQGQPSPGGRSAGGSRRTRWQHRRQRAGGVGASRPWTSSLASCVIALNPQRQEHRTDFSLPIPTSQSLPPWPGVGVCERAPPLPCTNTDRCTTSNTG